jgi:poly-beta-1,6-N-acetyl-D-glucosamine biosynthesis protein PgaD
MSAPPVDVPPLIVADKVSRALKWRDAVLTLLMWGIIANLLAHELGLVWVDSFALHGPDAAKDIDWLHRLEGLSLFLIAAAVLSSILTLFGVRTARRRRRIRALPLPEPLATADQARRAGLEEAALLAAREHRIVTVHLEPDGRFRIEAPRESP